MKWRGREVPRSEGRLGWPWEAAEPAAQGGAGARLLAVVYSGRDARDLEERIRSVVLQPSPVALALVGPFDGCERILETYRAWIASALPSAESLSAAVESARRAVPADYLTWLLPDTHLLPGASAAVAGANPNQAAAVAGGLLATVLDTTAYQHPLAPESARDTGISSTFDAESAIAPAFWVSTAALDRRGPLEPALRDLAALELRWRLESANDAIATHVDVIARRRFYPLADASLVREARWMDAALAPQLTAAQRSLLHLWLEQASREGRHAA